MADYAINSPVSSPDPVSTYPCLFSVPQDVYPEPLVLWGLDEWQIKEWEEREGRVLFLLVLFQLIAALKSLR